MVGRGSVAALLGAALLMLGASAPALAQDEQRMVMVTGSPAMIEALEGKGYDVGFVGELNEAGVYVDDADEARLRAEGYTIGQTVEDASTRLAVKAADRRRPPRARQLAAEVAKNGLTKSAKAKGAVNVPGNVMIQRAYTFTNYAGRFLYVEAHNKLHGDTTGPAMSFTYTSPNGTSQVFNLSNSTISPDGNDSAIGGNKLSDGDAGAGARYMYHRGLVALRNADANLQACRDHASASPTPSATSTRAASPSGRARPCRRASPGSRRTSSRSTWTRPRPTTGWTRSTAQFPDIMRGDQPAQQDQRLRPSGDGDDGRQPGRQRHAERGPDPAGGLPDVRATRRPRRQQHHRRVQGSGRRHAERAAVDHGDRRHVAHPRSCGHRRQQRHRRDRGAGRRTSSSTWPPTAPAR